MCGNGIVEGQESCDDGNLLDGDGCSAGCLIVVNGEEGEVESGLIAYWKFDGDYSDSASGNHGSAVGDVGFVSGVNGKGIELKGDDLVKIKDGWTGFNNDFTISAWYLDENSGQDSQIVTSDQGKAGNKVYLRINSRSKKLRCAIGNNEIEGLHVPDGDWHNVVCTRNNDGKGKLYLDGELLASGTGGSGNLELKENDYLSMGARYNGEKGHTGKIDEVKIYDRVLSAGEIKDLN